MAAQKGPLVRVIQVYYSFVEIFNDFFEFTGAESIGDVGGHFEEIVPIVQMSHIEVVILGEVGGRHRSS